MTDSLSIAVHAFVSRMCKPASSNFFKNKITYKYFTYKSYLYVHLNVWKQITDVILLLLHSNTWKQLTACQQMINTVWSGFFV